MRWVPSSPLEQVALHGRRPDLMLFLPRYGEKLILVTVQNTVASHPWSRAGAKERGGAFGGSDRLAIPEESVARHVSYQLRQPGNQL